MIFIVALIGGTLWYNSCSIAQLYQSSIESTLQPAMGQWHGSSHVSGYGCQSRLPGSGVGET